MISLTALSERIAASALTIDRVLGLSPLEDFLADHEDHPDKDGVLTPKLFRSAIGDETLKVALSTMRKHGCLVCNKFTISLESDAAAEAQDGMVFLTLKRSPLARRSRVKIEAEFTRSEDPEGVERLREKLNHESFEKGE